MKKSQPKANKPVTLSLIKGEKKQKWVDIYFNGVKITWLPFWYNKEYGIKAYERCAEVLFTDFAQKIVGLTKEEIWNLPDYAEMQKRYDAIVLGDIVKNFVNLELKPKVYQGNTYELEIWYNKMYMGKIFHTDDFPLYVYYKAVMDLLGNYHKTIPVGTTQQQMVAYRNEEMNKRYETLRGGKENVSKVLKKYL